jgi:branched-chain amino acid transport system substrate-binding protein
MVVVEGLQRAGRDLTRGEFITATESIHARNAGWGPRLILNYGANDHEGFDNVYPPVVKSGQPVLLTDCPSLGKVNQP